MHAQTWLSCPRRPAHHAILAIANSTPGRSALALAANLSMGLAPCDPALVPDATNEQTTRGAPPAMTRNQVEGRVHLAACRRRG